MDTLEPMFSTCNFFHFLSGLGSLKSAIIIIKAGDSMRPALLINIFG